MDRSNRLFLKACRITRAHERPLYRAGLQPSTTYTFAAQARYADGSETALGPATGARTTMIGDLNDDGRTDVLDMLHVSMHMGNTWCDGVEAATADLNGDGIVDNLDMDAFELNLSGS